MKNQDSQYNFKNTEDQQNTRALTRIILAELALFIIMGILSVFWKDWRTLWAEGIAIVLLIGPLWLFRHRYFQAGSLIFVVISIVITISIAMVGQGIYDLAIVAFPAISVLAGLILNRWLFRLCVGLSLVAVSWLVIGENMGLIITQPLPADPLHLFYLTGVITLLLVAAYAVELLATNSRKSLTQLRQEVERREQTEAALREQKALTDRILESTPDAMAVVGKDQQVIKVNKAFEHTFNLAKDKAEGKEIREIIPVSRLIETILQVMETSESKLQVEFKLKMGVQERVIIADIIIMQKNEVLAHFEDVTEEREMQERLSLTDRLASLGEMAAGIAHELNNPLTGVVAISQLLLESDVPAEIKDDLKAISSEGQRAASVVRNMLSFARSHTLSNQPVEINAIISQVLNLRTYEHRVSNIKVFTRFAPNLPEISADRFQMQQVFLNIVLNAEQAMIEAHDGGNLNITTEQLNDIIKISFSDDGPGIPQDIINRVFDPFFTTKEVGKGTGLGLSICYGIVTKQGGRIYAQSQPGKGVTFVVELPINAH